MMTVEEIIEYIEGKIRACDKLFLKAGEKGVIKIDVDFARAELLDLLQKIRGEETKEPETPTGGDMHWDGTVPLYTSDHKVKP